MTFTMKRKSSRGVIQVLGRKISSGILGDDDSITWDPHHHPRDKPRDRTSSAATIITTTSVSFEDDAISVISSKSTPYIAEPSSSNSRSETNILQDMVSQLSDEDKETAARTSYAYYCQSKSSEQSSASSMNVYELNRARDVATMAMARRHLNAEDGNADVALEKMLATIQWRREKRLDELRDCFNTTSDMYDSERSQQWRNQIRHFCGPDGKLFLRGYDRDHRSCWHTIGRHSPEGTNADHEGCMMSHYYMLERAVACSEARSLVHGAETAQEMVVVSVDFAGFAKKHAPELHTVKELLCGLRDHYPDRLYRVYLVDAPALFRWMWNLIKPLMDPDTKQKFQFVTGSTQRRKVFGRDFEGIDQCMRYQHPDGELDDDQIDMRCFFDDLDFTKSLDQDDFVVDDVLIEEVVL